MAGEPKTIFHLGGQWRYYNYVDSRAAQKILRIDGIKIARFGFRNSCNSLERPKDVLDELSLYCFE